MIGATFEGVLPVHDPPSKFEILVTRLCQSNIAPEFPAISRTHRAGQFNAFGVDPTSETECRVARLHIHIASFDIVSRDIDSAYYPIVTP